MSNFKKKQFVRPELDVQTINGLAQTPKGIPRKSLGATPLYTTGTLPDATHLPDGIIVIDITVNKVKYTRNGAWVATA